MTENDQILVRYVTDDQNNDVQHLLDCIPFERWTTEELERAKFTLGNIQSVVEAELYDRYRTETDTAASEEEVPNGQTG